MSAITDLFAGVPVSDLDASIDWYTRFFGRPPDSRVGDEVLWEIDEHALALHRAERGAGGHRPDHLRRRRARRAPRTPRRRADRARTDRDVLERRPPRERPRSGRERDRVRRAARRCGHTGVMATGLPVGGDLEQALEDVGVPSYVLDTTGVIRWINPAAERLVGDVRGRQFTSVVAPEDSRRARELVLPEGARHRRPPQTPRPSWSRRPARGWPWRSARCRS